MLPTHASPVEFGRDSSHSGQFAPTFDRAWHAIDFLFLAPPRTTTRTCAISSLGGKRCGDQVLSQNRAWLGNTVAIAVSPFSHPLPSLLMLRCRRSGIPDGARDDAPSCFRAICSPSKHSHVALLVFFLSWSMSCAISSLRGGRCRNQDFMGPGAWLSTCREGRRHKEPIAEIAATFPFTRH